MWAYPTYAAIPPTSLPLESQHVTLQIRQQPKEALVTQDGKEKVRKPVDPPPIVQMRITHAADPQQHYLSSPYLFMCCSLQREEEEGSKKGEIDNGKGNQPLAGCLVSSLHRLKDQDNSEGAYFVFGDISVKITGKHRLVFNLFDLRKDSGEVVFLQSITSDPFNVVQPKDFRGLEESTYLSRAFSDQGVRLRLRKEPRAFSSAQKRPYPYAVPPPPPVGESTTPRRTSDRLVNSNSDDIQQSEAKRFRPGVGFGVSTGAVDTSKDWNDFDQRSTQAPGRSPAGFSEFPTTTLPTRQNQYNYGNVGGLSNQNMPQYTTSQQSQYPQLGQVGSGYSNVAQQNLYPPNMYNDTAYGQRGNQFQTPLLGSNTGLTLSATQQPMASQHSIQPIASQQSMYRSDVSLPNMPNLGSNLLGGSQSSPFRPIGRYEENVQTARQNLESQTSAQFTQGADHGLSNSSMSRHDLYSASLPQDETDHEEYST